MTIGVEANVSTDPDEGRWKEASAPSGDAPETPPAGTDAGGEVNEHSFRLLVESVKEYSIFMLDRQGRVITWNPGAERIKGYRREEILGQHLSRFYPPEDPNQAHRALSAAESEGKFEEEGWRVRKDGARFWAHVLLTAIRDEAGELLGFAKVTRDLTERRRAEVESLRLSQSQEAVRLRDEFLTVAAHEFKTPLQNLKLQLELLGRAMAAAESPTQERIASKVEALRRQVLRLQVLSTRLLDFSAVRTGQLTPHFRPLVLAPAIRSRVEALSIELRQARCDVRLTEEPGLTALLDPSMFGEILDALFSNALKYGEGRPIEISTSEEDERVMVAVADHGIGVAQEDLERIFRKFERGVSPENYAGWGLGLFIARLLTELMGGSIEASSSLGRGSTFRVSFKRADFSGTEGADEARADRR